MRLRAWYVNNHCILVIDNASLENLGHGQTPEDWGGIFDSVMIFKDEVEIEKEVTT